MAEHDDVRLHRRDRVGDTGPAKSTPERVADTLADLADRGLTSRCPVIEHQSFPYWSKAVIEVDGTERRRVVPR
ncbi:hypothetical protein [Streptomyces sp. NPDC046332]|uniref:hypothetical protein n=1 Tax=unclassified Streptomyces TaxID=2593676 RepID=UPI0033E95A56